ncbi:MAG: TetR/AcrR family transcriptional regulator [Candidatus Omnitrophica bacterium]|nr:TetR/AcrR family transcriptional regulator [Candidatus Omnitrophota bacterium]
MNIYSLNSEITEESVPVLLDRKERHRLLRKTDIIRAAEHVFALKGFHKATIQDIARQAQYATGTVYLYFADKDSLYFSIVEEKIKRLLHILKLKASQVRGTREKLESSIYESLRFFDKEHDFFRIFVREESCWSIKSKLAKSTTAQERKEFSIKLMKEAQAEKIIRRDLLPGQVSDMLEFIITTFIFNWWEEGTERKKDLKVMSGIIMDLFLNGVKQR